MNLYCLARLGFGIAFSIVALGGCDTRSYMDQNSSGGTSSPQSEALSPKISVPSGIDASIGQMMLRVGMAEAVSVAANPAFYACDANVAGQSATPVKIEFGTITKDPDIGELGRAIPALRATFKLTCMQRKMGRKGDMFVGVFAGYDVEFETWRCFYKDSVSIYASDGNTAIGAKELRYFDERFEDRCGFLAK